MTSYHNNSKRRREIKKRVKQFGAIVRDPAKMRNLLSQVVTQAAARRAEGEQQHEL